MLTSIVVAPRERLTCLPSSLRSLFATVAADVPVIVVEGGSADNVRQELRALAAERPFRHIALPYMIKPHEARNMGFAEVHTEYVVFADNDLHYEPGWLSALEEHAVRHGSDAVAPLICIGPPKATTIHHAGGQLYTTGAGANIVLREQHRLMNEPMSALADPSSQLGNARLRISLHDGAKRFRFRDGRL
jgi:glycosyltransferase involved in cell wall biosynthesis